MKLVSTGIPNMLVTQARKLALSQVMAKGEEGVAYGEPYTDGEKTVVPFGVVVRTGAQSGWSEREFNFSVLARLEITPKGVCVRRADGWTHTAMGVLGYMAFEVIARLLPRNEPEPEPEPSPSPDADREESEDSANS